MFVKKSKPSVLNLNSLKQVIWCIGACFFMILCVSCSHKVDEEEMLAEYDGIISDYCEFCDMAIKEDCISNMNRINNDYGIEPECGRYKKIETALLLKCTAEFSKEYGKEYCEGKVRPAFFSGFFCTMKYSSNILSYENLVIKCICDHWNAYEKSDLSDYDKEVFYEECKKRGYK